MSQPPPDLNHATCLMRDSEKMKQQNIMYSQFVHLLFVSSGVAGRSPHALPLLVSTRA